jgi:mannose-6-phosphate isomerase
VIDEEQAQEFANIYFEGFNVDMLRVAGKLSQ